MKQQNKKKPTAKQLEIAINNLIMEVQRSQIEIIRTQKILDDFIDYKKETENFTKYLEVKYARENEKNDKRNTNKK
tara:strand:- start:369 stop:596 length:228 start_codon:yes stop_codon:yes gene_type:complete